MRAAPPSPAVPQEVRPGPSAAVHRESKLASWPVGGCAQTPELMFNGNQRWKKTLEDPVPFHPRLLLRPGAATLGVGGFRTRT